MSVTFQKVYNAILDSYQVAVDRILHIDYQLFKLIDSTPGSVAPIGVAANPLVITGSVTTGGSSTPTVLGSGQKNVTTAGTAVQLASTLAVKSITIKANATNTGSIYVGSSTVTSSTGFILGAGDTFSFDLADLATVWINSSVSGEGVSFGYVA